MRRCERCRHLDPRFRDPNFRPRHEPRPCPPKKHRRHHRH
jgi:hypothetical protein